MAFNGRLAIVVGGFGGLGSETGKLLRAQGAHLALLYASFEASRKQDVLDNTYGHPEKNDISTYECDITSAPSVDAAFAAIADSAAKTNTFPSILVNAAGYVSVQPLIDTPPDESSKNINANLLGPIFTSQAFARLYRSAKQSSSSSSSSAAAPPPPGRIVSISSQAAHVALDGHGPYCASKAGLMGLTRCMASEWGPMGVTANTVSPTVALTALGRKAWADDAKRNEHLAQIPAGRFALPEEIADAIVFLCKDESGMVNGADVKIDGGFTARGTGRNVLE